MLEIFTFTRSIFRRIVLTAALLAIAGTNAHALDKRALPEDTHVIFTLNLKQAASEPQSLQDAVRQVGGVLLQCALVNSITKELDQHPPFDQALKLLRTTGFDPVSDLYALSVAGANTDQSFPEFWIVDGRFDQEKFERAAREAGARAGSGLRTAQAGKFLVCEAANVRTAWFAVVEGKTLLLSYKENMLRDALVRIGENRFVATQVAQLLPMAHDRQTISVVMSADMSTKLAIPILDLADFPHFGICGAMTLAGDLQFELRACCKDEATTRKLALSLDKLCAQARMTVDQQAGNNERPTPEQETVRTLRVVQTGNHCGLALNVSYYNAARFLGGIIHSR